MFLPWILQAALVTAVPAQQEIAEVHALVKRQATPTYAQSCVVYSQVIAIGAATTTSCTDATAAGPNYVQSCTGLINILPLGYNCGSVFTAVSSCPVTTTTTVGGLIFKTTDTIFITGTNCVTPTYPARPKSTTVMATTSSAAATPTSTTATPAATTTKASSTSLAVTTTRASSTSLASPTTSLAPTSTSIAAQAATTTSVVLSSSVQSTSTKATTTSSSLPMFPTTSSAAVLTSTVASTTSVLVVPTTSLAPSSSSVAITSTRASTMALSSTTVTTSSSAAAAVMSTSSAAVMSTSSAAALTSSLIATSGPAAVTSSAVVISSSIIKASSSTAMTSALSTISSAAATSSALPTTSSAAATSLALPASSSSAVVSTLVASSRSFATTSAALVQSSSSKVSSVVSSSASAAPTSGLPRTAKNGATYIGCFQDGIDQRTLQQRTNDVNNIEECVSQCGSAGFDRAGVEYYTQCFCGYASAGYNGQPQIDDGICSVPCNDPTQTCGNGNAIQIYAIPNALVNPSPVANTPTPTPSPTTGLPRLSRNGGQYLGCFRDDVSQRALPVRVGDVGTVEACISSCQSAGYALAGLEYFYQCFCGNGGTNGQPQIDDGSCNAPCNDDKSQTCGGSNAIQLYSVPQGAGAPTIPTSVTTSTGSGAYQGCYSDDVNFRTLPNRVADAGSVDQCVNSCINAGYAYAGIEYTRECYCGNSVGASLIDNAQCQKYTCTENSSQKCGGDNAIQVYSLQSSSAPPAATGTWSYVGCLQDFYPNTRTLQGYTVTSNSMTQQFCKSTCQAKGFTYAGVEYSGECFCDNQIHNNPQTLNSCTMACSGDSSQLCGGSNAIQVYTLNTLSSSAGSGPTATAGPASPKILQVTSGGATYNGCYTDSVNARALRNRLSDVTGSDPVSTCMSACKAAGYTLGAVEYGRECFCDVSINNGHSLTSDGACNMLCDGNSQQYCGNGNTAQVYNL